jgi:hypothetical protein
MLGGLAPIIILTFPKQESMPFAGHVDFGRVQQTPTGGVPIPIYLDERLTGIYIVRESHNIDIATRTEAKLSTGKPDFSQRAVDSTVSIDIEARRDNVLLSVLVAFSRQIFQKVVSREYSIDYVNGPVLIFGGLLDSFVATPGDDDTKMRVSLVISRAAEEASPTKAPEPPIIQKVTGTIPAGGA